jgi:hypothetical protein
VSLSSLGTSATSGPTVSAQDDDDDDSDEDHECGAVGGMRICRGNRNTRRKYSPAPQKTDVNIDFQIAF